MAIVKVQSVTGNGATLVLNGVAAGNSLFLIDSYFRNVSTGVSEPVPTDSNGTFLIARADAPSITGHDIGVGIFHEANVAAGTHTVTPQANDTHLTTLVEFSGLVTSGLFDASVAAQNGSGTGTSQSTGTTGVTVQADELSIIAFCMGAGTGSSNVGLTDPVTNYTTLQIGQDDASSVAMLHGYRVLSATGAQSATFNWTASDAGQWWQAAIATFKAVVADIGPALNIPIRGGRGPRMGPAMRRMQPQKFPTAAPIDTITPAPQIQPLRSRGPGMGPRLRRMFPQKFADTSTGTTLLPTEGAITISGVAASLTLTIAAVAGAITIAGNAPSVSTILQGVQGSIVISGNTASTSSILAPTVGAVVISGGAPALTQTLVGVTGAVTIGGNAPSLTGILAATEGAIVISGNAPSLTVSGGLSPTEGALSFDGNAPTISLSISGQEGSLTVSGNIPSIESLEEGREIGGRWAKATEYITKIKNRFYWFKDESELPEEGNKPSPVLKVSQTRATPVIAEQVKAELEVQSDAEVAKRKRIERNNEAIMKLFI